MGADVTKYLRPATLPEIPDTKKRARVYPLWPDKFVSAPQWWMIAAAQVSKKSPWTVMVGLALWQQHRFNKGKRPLKLTGPTLQNWRIKRIYARRAVRALATAGLITVQRFKHRSPLITLMTGQKHG